MTQHIALLDWLVIAVYLIGLVAFAVWLSRRQQSREDYYVGARGIGTWPVAVSIMATQCSTNSILGAPAFVGFTEAGGLKWLQYELAVPLAMLVLILVLVPVFKSLPLVSIYAYLERRFDRSTRLMLSGLFLFVRAFATSVTVYSIALVLDMITGVGFAGAVVLLGVFTVVYDVFGGIKGVVYSDVLQMIILVAVLVVLLYLVLGDSGGWPGVWSGVDDERKVALDFAHHGLGDGHTFAFWPMLFGGLFLYVAYYGCDQSQMQRLLSTADQQSASKALVINGLLRFPVVALYCFLGLALAAFSASNPGFIELLPRSNGEPQYNLVVPTYMVNFLPVGLVGLGLVALFAAAMSSLDSVINSLSATTMEDFVRPRLKNRPGDLVELHWSRGLTVGWGVITLAMAFFVGDIAPTVLEAINKIGSLANGPILAVFLAAVLLPRVGALGVKSGLVAGILANACLWLWVPSVSWLWWNVSGCLVTLALALVVSSASPAGIVARGSFSAPAPAVAILVAGFVAMLAMLAVLSQAH